MTGFTGRSHTITRADAERLALRFWQRKWPQVTTAIDSARCEDLATGWIIGCNHATPPGAPKPVPGMIGDRPPGTRRLLIDHRTGSPVELAAAPEQEACELELYRRTGRIRGRLQNRVIVRWTWGVVFEQSLDDDESLVELPEEVARTAAQSTFDEWQPQFVAGIRRYSDCPVTEISEKIEAVRNGRPVVLLASSREDLAQFVDLLQRIPGIMLYR